MLTPKLQDAVQLAGTAADHTLNRCRGGWFSRSATASPHGAQVVTTRTANAEAETVDAFLARGGTVERLPPSATSNPLRHDYPEAFA